MDWNNPRSYQLPTQSTFAQQSHESAQSWYYDDEGDEEVSELRQGNTTLQFDRYPDRSAVPPPHVIPSLKMESSGMISDNGSNAVPQLMTSLNIPQLEESTEFRPFFSTPSADSAYLSENQPQPLQMQEQNQLSPQLSAQFTHFPSAMATYYPPLTPPAPTSMLAATRPSVDYYSEGTGIPTLHSTHYPVPTLPSTFGSLQQQPQAILEDRSERFDNGINAALPVTPTETAASLQTLPANSMDKYADFQTLSINTPSDYPPRLDLPSRDKRGRELGAPFAEMATILEPKFSPDKRKLCCVEGCKSQARAFNRCKRHGGSKRCSSPGCTKSVQSRGLCIRHGGGSRCQEVGCGRASQSHGRCKMHGGGRPCIVAGCEKKAHLKRLCRKHGGGAKCCITGCDKWAQRQGMCMTHSKIVGTQPSGMDMLGDSFLTDRNASPPPSAPGSSPSPSLQFFSDNV